MKNKQAFAINKQIRGEKQTHSRKKQIDTRGGGGGNQTNTQGIVDGHKDNIQKKDSNPNNDTRTIDNVTRNKMHQLLAICNNKSV